MDDSKYIVGQLIRVKNGQWHGKQGRILTVDYTVKFDKSGRTVQFVKYTIAVAYQTHWTFFENQVEIIEAEVNEYYDSRYKAEIGHIITIGSVTLVVEDAYVRHWTECGSRMGHTDHRSAWHIRLRELRPDGSYNPLGVMQEFDQTTELNIIGQMQKQIDFVS